MIILFPFISIVLDKKHFNGGTKGMFYKLGTEKLKFFIVFFLCFFRSINAFSSENLLLEPKATFPAHCAIGVEKDVSFKRKFYVLHEPITLMALSKIYNLSVRGFKYLNPKDQAMQPGDRFVKGSIIVLPVSPLTFEQSYLFDKKIEDFCNKILDANKNKRKLHKRVPVKKIRSSVILEKENKNSENIDDDSGLKAYSNIDARLNLNNIEKIHIRAPAEDPENYVKQEAISKLSAPMHSWLNQYGNAQISLDLNDKFSLRNSTVSFLFPLYDKKRKLLFTQINYFLEGKRKQVNFGLGMRYFGDHFMLGLNSFVDYDLTENYLRSSVGAELGFDFFQLAGNYYYRLSDWKGVANTDKDARPANGWDIRAKAYLPFWPHLGFDIGYFQYYGQDIAVLSNRDVQNDPYGEMLGIEYTPVPLLSFNVQAVHSYGHNEIRFGGSLNIHFGVSLREQLDPDNIYALRSLRGNRYDFVKRNNTILLEYKHHDPIEVFMPEDIEGYAQHKYPIKIKVQSRFGLAKLLIDGSSLVTAGGKIEKENEAEHLYLITLPNYDKSEGAYNVYAISAIAIDVKGNDSHHVYTNIHILPPNYETLNTSLTPSSVVLKADGYSHKILTLKIKLKPEQMSLLRKKDLSLKIIRKKPLNEDSDQGIPARIEDFRYSEPGVYLINVIAGTREEDITLIPSFRGENLPSAHVKITASDPE